MHPKNWSYQCVKLIYFPFFSTSATLDGSTYICVFLKHVSRVSACLSASYAESNECGKELSFASKLWREKEIHLLPLFVGSSLDEKNGDSDNAFDMNAFVAERVEKNDNDPDWIGIHFLKISRSSILIRVNSAMMIFISVRSI